MRRYVPNDPRMRTARFLFYLFIYALFELKGYVHLWEKRSV